MRILSVVTVIKDNKQVKQTQLANQFNSQTKQIKVVGSKIRQLKKF